MCEPTGQPFNFWNEALYKEQTEAGQFTKWPLGGCSFSSFKLNPTLHY